MKDIQLFSRVTFVDKLMFTKHLSIMIKSGVPIFDAIETLSTYAKSGKLKKTLTKILEDIANGESLYKAMRKHPKVFDKFYTSLIKISEESGTLEETLDFLSEQLSKDYALRQKIKSAMFYPTLIFFAGLGIGGFISLYVLPQLVDFFENMDVELPLPTRILLVFANVMKSHGIIIIGGILLGFFLFKFAIKTKKVKPFWDRIMVRIPIFGKLAAYGQLARFTRNLGILLKSGVPLADGLETSAESMSLSNFQDHLLAVREDLLRGKNISDSLSDHGFSEFPPIVTRMIRIGEKTGNLEEVLIYLSEFYEDEVDHITKNLSTVLEPMILIAMGVMVGFLAIAIIGPIYELTGSVNQ